MNLTAYGVAGALQPNPDPSAKGIVYLAEDVHALVAQNAANKAPVVLPAAWFEPGAVIPINHETTHKLLSALKVLSAMPMGEPVAQVVKGNLCNRLEFLSEDGQHDIPVGTKLHALRA